MSTDIFSSIPELISGILISSWEIFVEAAPYLIFGFAIAGILNVLVPDQKIVEYLGTSAGKIRSVINAALAGLPLPLCSCGVIPAAMSIRKRGANRGATLSFLISTPQTGMDSISITYALLDPLMAVFRPLATLATAILAGIADNLLIGEDPEKSGKSENEKAGKKAEILAVSTLVGVSVSGDKCSPVSCNCGTHEATETGKEKHPDKNTVPLKSGTLELKSETGRETSHLKITPAIHASENQTAGGHPTLKDGVCFGPPARLLGDR
ncbi:permease [Methanosarcina mazei]|uniref:Permease n=2 Tax=Methanosarcina mazei TaxID=2209 RepID=A0A0F8FWB0_METMZ|nr:permease [Methanosarcina mazei]KKG37664.1 permease [Methanosarcina mazei]KKH26318.1 permease [Methanosarcina mazei]